MTLTETLERFAPTPHRGLVGLSDPCTVTGACLCGWSTSEPIVHSQAVAEYIASIRLDSHLRGASVR